MYTLFLNLMFVLDASQACLVPSGIGNSASDVYSAANLSLPQSIFFGFLLPTIDEASEQFETPIQFRESVFRHIIMYNVMAAYENTPLDFWGREDISSSRKICQPNTTDTDAVDYLELHRKLAIIYGYYIPLYHFFQGVEGTVELAQELAQEFGIDNDNLNLCINDASQCDDLSTPWGLAYVISEEALLFSQNDGWNGDGSYDREYNKIPFSDFRDENRRYLPVNNPWILKFEDKWQPLLESDNLGFLYYQEHVVPQIGYTGKSYIFTNDEFCAWRENTDVTDADYDYEVEIELLFDRMANLDNDNGELKMDVEFFDNKDSIFALHSQFQSRRGNFPDTFEHIASKLVLSLAFYEGVLQVWKAKTDFDRDIETYAGVDENGATYGTQTFDASDFEPYIRTMPHAEYPSASACVCESGRTAFIDYFGSDDIISFIGGDGLVRDVDAFSSNKEPLSTPSLSYTVFYSSWKDLFDRCGDSRLDGGMHFTQSVSAGRQLCTDIGTRVSQTIKNLVNGDTPQYIVNLTDTDVIERDCYPHDSSSSSRSKSSSGSSSRSSSKYSSSSRD